MNEASEKTGAAAGEGGDAPRNLDPARAPGARRLPDDVADILEALPANVALLDRTGRIVAVNGGWRRFADESALSLATHGIGGCYIEAAGEAADCLREVIAGERADFSFVFSSHSEDRQCWFRAYFAPLRVAGEPGALVMHSDVSEAVAAEQRVFQLLHYDSLTGLPNRAFFLDRLRHMLAQGQRYHRKLAVLFIDLDRFKVINDTLGHQVGDELLQQFGQRLSAACRASDTLGRFGGDEFVMILPDLRNGQEAVAVARKLIGLLAEPFRAAGQDLYVGASIGVAVFPDDADDADTLLRYADTAMFRAKDLGRGGWQFLRP